MLKKENKSETLLDYDINLAEIAAKVEPVSNEMELEKDDITNSFLNEMPIHSSTNTEYGTLLKFENPEFETEFSFLSSGNEKEDKKTWALAMAMLEVFESGELDEAFDDYERRRALGFPELEGMPDIDLDEAMRAEFLSECEKDSKLIIYGEEFEDIKNANQDQIKTKIYS